MQIFTFSFTVQASLAAVAAFHRDTRALKRLTPPPVWVQMHRVEPMAEGSYAEFTLWFGPLPIRWLAQHANVHPLNGFTDRQVRGPMKFWAHTHTFAEEANGVTRITERIEYEHHAGISGLLTRLLFSHFGLWLTFLYRQERTRRLLKSKSARLSQAA